jgi:DNA polymerase-4
VIACISVPYFAAAVERRSDGKLEQNPLTIGGQPWEARPIYAFSQEAAQQGVRIGMSLRLAHVLSPHSHFLPAAETRYSKVSGELVDLLLDFSPLIEPQEWWHPIPARQLPARYCLDLEGLPQREALPFVQEMGRTLRKETLFSAAIGLATHKFTAEVAATVCRDGHMLSVQVGQDESFLAARPLDFLPLERDIARRLRLLGIYRLGQLANLPLPALQEQFGPAIVPHYRRAKGEAEEALAARPPERVETVELRFEGAVSTYQAVAGAGKRLAAELAHRLRKEGLVARKLQLVLDLEEDEPQQQTLILSRPTADSGRLSDALQEMLARVTFTSAVYRLGVTLSDISPAQKRQLSLFDVAGRAADRANGGDRRLESLRNVIIKYRQSNFFQPQLSDAAHPLPERRFLLRPLSHDAFVA